MSSTQVVMQTIIRSREMTDAIRQVGEAQAAKHLTSMRSHVKAGNFPAAQVEEATASVWASILTVFQQYASHQGE